MIEQISPLYAAVWQSVPFEERSLLLSCVQDVQGLLSAELGKRKPGSRLARLCLADITETLLIKALHVLLQDPSLPASTNLHHQRNFLKVHLRFTLIEWLAHKAETGEELSELQRVRLPGSINSK